MPEIPERIPYSWAMSDPRVLAHRFYTPARLPPYTAVTIAPGQAGFFFVNDETHLIEEAGTCLLTGNLIHTLEEAEAIQRACGTAVTTYNAQLTLFDMRRKLYPTQPLDLVAGSGEHSVVGLTIAYRIDSVEKLNSCGGAFVPGEQGQELRQDDPLLNGIFASAIAEVTTRLLARAAVAETAEDVERLMLNRPLQAELRAVISDALSRLGLRAENVHLTPRRLVCPHCMKPLSLTDVRLRRHGSVDDAGRPQNGCGQRLHACPACGAIVSLERRACPACEEELLFCETPGCETFRRVEKGRFCTICRRACYPLLPRELLMNR